MVVVGINTVCRACKKRVNVGDLVKVNGTPVCGDCASKSNLPQDLVKKETTRSKFGETRMVCGLCKFKFSTAKDPKEIIRCPFCDKPGYVKREITSYDVLSDVSRIE